MSTRWLPRELTVDNKQRCLGIWQLLRNARPHAAAKTIEGIGQLSFEVLQHSAYSSDLAPSDYHFFGSRKVALRGRRFFSDEATREAERKWLRDEPKIFFADGIYKLVDRWKKCIEKGGNYVEK